MKKVLRVFVIAVIATMFANVATAQEKKKDFTIDKLSVEGRVDYDYVDRNNSGFDGRFFNFEMKGSFLEDFSYRIRQRIDMTAGGSKTDFMILSYHANKNWSLTAGRMPLAVGGWEYDLPPIDVYFASLFWNEFSCYDIGGQLVVRRQIAADTVQLRRGGDLVGAFRSTRSAGKSGCLCAGRGKQDQ